MKFPDRGDDFFGDGVIAMRDVIHDNARELFNTALQKDNVKKVLIDDKSFSLTYRIESGADVSSRSSG